MEGNGSLLGHSWESNHVNLPSNIDSSGAETLQPPSTPPDHASALPLHHRQESLVSAQTLANENNLMDPLKLASTASDASSVVRLQQNLQRIYGSLGQFNTHGSKSNLPNIQEDEETDAIPPLVPPSLQSVNTRAMSDEDLFVLDGQTGASAAAAALPDLSTTSQLPVQTAESRTLFIRNVDPQIPDEILKEYFECFGDIHSLYSASKHRGFIMVTYHDIRAARLAQHTLHGQTWRGRQIACTYSQAGDGVNPNSSMGVVLLISLDNGRSLDDVFYILSNYGELRELRKDPSRPQYCIAEFFDDRHALAAREGIAGSPQYADRLVAMDAAAAIAAGVMMPTPPSSASGNGVGASVASANAAQGLVPSRPLHNSSSSQLSEHPSTSALLGHGSVGGGMHHHQLSGIDLAGMTRNLSEMSLDNSAGGQGSAASLSSAGLHHHHLQGQMGIAGASAGDLLSQAAMAAAAARGGSNPQYPMRGAASTGSLWMGGQGAPGTVTPSMGQPSLSNSPASSAVWSSQVQEVLAAQQQLAAMQQQHHQQQQQQQQHHAAMQAVLQQAILSQQVAAATGMATLNKPDIIGGGLSRRGFSDPSLGGRLARRPMDPAAEAERRAQQERLYGLDMHRIARGEDKRTTLMIKNIPNKYTQKMLLSLIEERFVGVRPFPFDFFYLPIDFKNRCNVGYAFINMSSPSAIPGLVEEFHGKRWPKFNSEKICQIAYARIQGKAALVQHFQNSSLLHEDKRCRPVLFTLDGEVEVFPIGLAGGSPGGSANMLLQLSGSP